MWLYHDEMGSQKTTTLGLNKMEIRIPSDSKLLPIFFECPISDCVDQPRVTDSALAQIEQFVPPKLDYCHIRKHTPNMIWSIRCSKSMYDLSCEGRDGGSLVTRRQTSFVVHQRHCGQAPNQTCNTLLFTNCQIPNDAMICISNAPTCIAFPNPLH